jgi:hypothetical protein
MMAQPLIDPSKQPFAIAWGHATHMLAHGLQQRTVSVRIGRNATPPVLIAAHLSYQPAAQQNTMLSHPAEYWPACMRLTPCCQCMDNSSMLCPAWGPGLPQGAIPLVCIAQSRNERGVRPNVGLDVHSGHPLHHLHRPNRGVAASPPHGVRRAQAGTCAAGFGGWVHAHLLRPLPLPVCPECGDERCTGHHIRLDLGLQHLVKQLHRLLPLAAHSAGAYDCRIRVPRRLAACLLHVPPDLERSLPAVTLCGGAHGRGECVHRRNQAGAPWRVPHQLIDLESAVRVAGSRTNLNQCRRHPAVWLTPLGHCVIPHLRFQKRARALASTQSHARKEVTHIPRTTEPGEIRS